MCVQPNNDTDLRSSKFYIVRELTETRQVQSESLSYEKEGENM